MRHTAVKWALRFAAIVVGSLLGGGCLLGPSIKHTHTCFTQPQVYCSPTGQCQQEIDHYEQEAPCPTEPIK